MSRANEIAKTVEKLTTFENRRDETADKWLLNPLVWLRCNRRRQK